MTGFDIIYKHPIQCTATVAMLVDKLREDYLSLGQDGSSGRTFSYNKMLDSQTKYERFIDLTYFLSNMSVPFFGSEGHANEQDPPSYQCRVNARR